MKVTIFFNMNGDGLREKELAREALSHIPDILTVSGGRHNLEVSHINSGKGKGLLRLGEILGIDPSRTMGCGDEENDLDLIISTAFNPGRKIVVAAAGGHRQTGRSASFSRFQEWNSA